MADHIGPTLWNEDDLQLAGALNVGPLPLIDISTPLHTLFDRARWEVDDEVYRLLLPSMRFATNLITVNIPYIASFLPSDPVHMSLRPRYYTQEDEVTGIAPPKDYTIPLRDVVNFRDLDETRRELELMTDCIRWQINDEMLNQHGWLGITRVVDTPRPWRLVDTDLVVTGDEAHEQDTVRRPLILAICEEYLNAIRYSPTDSELHLKAIFMTGVTIAHEIGHAIWHQDYRSYDYRDPDTDVFDNEPWVGNDAINEELGNAFICYTFSGFTPDFCRMTPKEHGEATAPFKNALYWKRHPQINRGKRELYSTGYAIPISYIHKVLSQSFWDELGDPTVPGFYNNAYAKLQPNTEIQATKNFAEYTVGRDGATWNNTQVDRRRAIAADLQRLTQAELDWQRHWQIAVRTGGAGPAPLRRQIVPQNSTALTSSLSSGSTQKPFSGQPSHRDNSSTSSQPRTNSRASTGPNLLAPSAGIVHPSDDYYDESDEENYGLNEITDDDEKSNETQTEKEARQKAHIEKEAQEMALAKNETEEKARADRLAADEARYNVRKEQMRRMGHGSDEDDSDDDNLATDDEEAFGHAFGDEDRKSRPHIPNDGILVADVQNDSPNPPVSSLIDLEVRYRPDEPANTTKRARSGDDEDDYSGRGSAKRQKMYGGHVEHEADKYTKVPYDYNDIDALLLNKMPLAQSELANDSPVLTLRELGVGMADLELASYFRTWNLPRWGSRLVQEERVTRHREELCEGMANRFGNFRNEKLVTARVTAGVELYRCEAWDTTTTISQLRDWLFLIAFIPAGSEIDLYLGPDRGYHLDVDKTFYHYGDSDWSTIWMVLRRYQGEGLPDGGYVGMNGLPVCQPIDHGSGSGSQGLSQPPLSNSGSGGALPPGNTIIDLTGDIPRINSAVIDLTSPSISPSTNPQDLINQLAPIISNTINPSSSSEDFVNQVAPVIINLISPSVNPREVIMQIRPKLQDIVSANNSPEEAIKLIAAPIIDLVSPNSSSVVAAPTPVLPTVNALLASIMARRPTLSSILQPGGGIDPLRPELNGQISRSAFEILDNVEEAEELNETIRGGLLANVIAGGQQLPDAGSNGIPIWVDHTPDELLGDEDFLGAARRVLNQGAPDMGALGARRGGFGRGGIGQVLGTGVQVVADEDEGLMPGSFMREVYDRPF